MTIQDACDVVNFPKSSFYRYRKPRSAKATERGKSFRALTEAERYRVLDTLHERRFADKAPAQVFASLLDGGVYLCSTRTMYRILHEHDEVRERRNILRHPQYKKPELLATAPNQVWSWDITKVKGPVKWSYFYLYVILDIFSRNAVGWMIAHRETAALAKVLISETCARQGIDANQLLIHSDRGSPMTSKAVALLMSDLGITKSFSRPRVSNDNPFSESHFKTLKYRPAYPERFGCIEDARAFFQRLFNWYNNEHYHSGLGLMTPSMVHYGFAEECNRQRQAVLSAAYAAHPERFPSGHPRVLELPKEVWINQPPPVVVQASAPDTGGSTIIIGGG